MHRVRCNVCKRNQHERALVHAGVWYDEIRGVPLFDAVEQKIQIQCARPMPVSVTRSTRARLDGLEHLQ